MPRRMGAPGIVEAPVRWGPSAAQIPGVAARIPYPMGVPETLQLTAAAQQEVEKADRDRRRAQWKGPRRNPKTG